MEFEKSNLVSISKLGEKIFINPYPTYSYNEIITGCKVIPNKKSMCAVAENTFKAFGYNNDDMYLAMRSYKEFFIDQKEVILATLKDINCSEQLDLFEDNLYGQIKSILSKYLYNKSKLLSYNRIRKPIDLYVENIVALANEMNGYREKLVKYLFLPLDSWMFKSKVVIHEDQFLFSNNLTRRSKMGDVRDRNTYEKLQGYLSEKVLQINKIIGRDFYRIYFDFFWRDRYRNRGTNLFLSNFEK